MEKGILYGIGVGCGNSNDITIGAIYRIKKCDVIMLPAASKESCVAYQIIKDVIPELEEKEFVCREFPMIRDREQIERVHDGIFCDLCSYLDDGKNVAFLTIGDITIYSTYCYVHSRIIASGRQARMVNGVPSFCSVAAALGVSIAVGNEQIHILPGFDNEEMRSGNVYIYMKIGRKLPLLISELEKLSEKKTIDVCGASDFGLENETMYCGIDALKEYSGNRYFTTVIVRVSDMIELKGRKETQAKRAEM